MTAFNKLFPIILIILVLVSLVEAQTKCTRYAEPGFSICIPDNWTKEDDPGETLKKFFAPPTDGGRQNLNFQIAANSIALADYVTAIDKYTQGHVAQLGFDRLSLVSRNDLVTDSKENGIRLVYRLETKGMKIRSFQYCFVMSPSKKIILTFTANDSNSEENERLFDRIVTTFRTEK